MKKKRQIFVKVLFLTVTVFFLLSGCQSKISGDMVSEEEKQVAAAKSLAEEQRVSEETRVRLEKEIQLQQERKAEEEKRKLEEQKKLDEQKKAEAEKASAAVKPVETQMVSVEELINSEIPLEEKVKKYLGSNLSKVGFVYYDLITGEKIAFNENKIFLAASTVKVQMNIIAYDWVKAGKLSLEETIAYSSSYYEGGTGILQGMDKSKPISVQTLLDYSIIYSDNIATNMMLRRLGGSKSVRAATNSMVGTNVDTSSNNVSPEEEFRVLKRLYEGRNDKYYAHLIEVMKKTTFHDRLDKYIPQSITAHKIGNYGSYVNDVGIIYADKPYILVIYTNGLPGASEKIAQISKIVYKDQLKK